MPEKHRKYKIEKGMELYDLESDKHDWDLEKNDSQFSNI